jgi:serine/threonine-protein kinase
MPLESGQLVAGRFQLDRMIGRGGMGSVWKARDGRLDMPCAVKFIEGEIASNPEATMRFEREAKAAAQLRSPHVVQILDHGLWESMPYIAMELLEGEDLGKRLSSRGRLTPAEVSAIITQVCRALAKAHTAGIVHRDLKPDNIFLCRDDDREIAKVVDFGIAKAMNNSLEMDSKTRTGSLLGTPYYMSPEQASGARDKPVDARSDLWSLAVIVYQCVTGQLPFDGDALGDLLVKIIVGPIPRPSDVASDLPMGFDDWWAKAASREPGQRYQTAKEFAESLALVCGTSQMTDVMDRAVIQNALASQAADRSGAHAAVQTPTGGTMSRTIGQDFEGLQGFAPKKKSAAPMVVGALVAVLALGGGVFAMKGKEESTPASATTASTAAAAAPAAPAPTPEPAAAQDAGAHVAEPAAPEPAKAEPAAAPVARPAKSRGGFAPAPAPAAPAAAPAAAPTPAAKPASKPQPAGDDLGF